ncbi:MAG: HipA N-terminal domain-containing protein [Prevotellamassilia sp.]|nr:HipA N-terminal domain-containing protein [Prevotellamassilia sp.]
MLTEDAHGYTFEYDADYLTSDDAEAVSLTLPLSDKEFDVFYIENLFVGNYGCNFVTP